MDDIIHHCVIKQYPRDWLYVSKFAHKIAFTHLLGDPRIERFIPTALPIAVGNGNNQLLKLLLTDPRVDPAEKDNYAIRYACELGNAETVEILLKDNRVDPTVWDKECLPIAMIRGYDDVVKLFLHDKRVNPALTGLKDSEIWNRAYELYWEVNRK